MIHAIIFAVTYLLRNLLEVVVQPRKKIHHLFEKGTKQGFFSLLMLSLCSVVPAVIVCYRLYTEGPDSVLSYVGGMLIFLLGFGGRAAALKQLGTNYSQDFRVVPGGELIRTGIYAVIRNPIYMAFIIEVAGLLLVKFSYVTLVAVLILFPVSLFRIKAEENFLLEKYGASFQAYMNRTKRLVPFLY